MKEPAVGQVARAKPKAGSSSSIDVMIADDHPLIIEGLAAALHGFGIKVIARASETGQIVDLYAKARPQVIVLDLRFGEQASGIDAARDLLERFPDARIVMYSQFDQDAVIRDAYQVGVLAYITKNANPLFLVEAIRRAKDGKTFFLPEIAERLALLSVRAGDTPLNKLAGRDLEVFRLMAEGRTIVEIAEMLNLSTKTISITSQSIKEVLGVHRPADITLLAVRHGFITL